MTTITKTTTAPLVVLLCAAALTLGGCAADSTAPVANETPAADAPGQSDAPSDDAAEDDAAESPTDNPSSDEVTVIGGELVGGFVLVASEQYATGRTPVPTVEFTSANDVTFTFNATLDEVTLIGNCQIAYGVLDAEGVSITIVDGSGTFNCTAFIEE